MRGVLLASATFGCIALAVWTQPAPAQSDVTLASEASYLPSISDFMLATIQPRHIRLWVAAQTGNWPFAAYELGNLKGAFDRLGRAHPTVRETNLSAATRFWGRGRGPCRRRRSGDTRVAGKKLCPIHPR